MPLITLEKADKEAAIARIREYAERELDKELSPFEAGFLLNFFAEEIGPYFYNKGLLDAQAILNKRMEEISGAIDSLTKPTPQRRR
jgi:uncharacterized protein (DUF2164 family)